MAGTQPSQRTRHDLYEEQKLRQVRVLGAGSAELSTDQLGCALPALPQLGITPQHRAILEGVYEVRVRLPASSVPSRSCCGGTPLSGRLLCRAPRLFRSAGEASGAARRNEARHAAGGGRAGGEGATQGVTGGRGSLTAPTHPCFQAWFRSRRVRDKRRRRSWAGLGLAAFALLVIVSACPGLCCRVALWCAADHQRNGRQLLSPCRSHVASSGSRCSNDIALHVRQTASCRHKGLNGRRQLLGARHARPRPGGERLHRRQHGAEGGGRGGASLAALSSLQVHRPAVGVPVCSCRVPDDGAECLLVGPRGTAWREE